MPSGCGIARRSSPDGPCTRSMARLVSSPGSIQQRQPASMDCSAPERYTVSTVDLPGASVRHREGVRLLAYDWLLSGRDLASITDRSSRCPIETHALPARPTLNRTDLLAATR